MTHEVDDPPTGESSARQRIAEITALFANMRALMTKWSDDAGPASSKQMLTKISELQSAHLLVMRAEEAFYDKFGNGEINAGIDYDAARTDIGRELDRLRVALEAGYLSEGTDDGAD
jgi:hypothetical protein